LNAARQAGSAIGVALLGALLAGQVVTGLHTAMGAAAASFWQRPRWPRRSLAGAVSSRALRLLAFSDLHRDRRQAQRLAELAADAKLERCPAGAVLVSRSPPKGYVDSAHGRHLGSEAVLRAIESKRPRLTVCGHIHQAWGEEATVAGTSVVNLGPEGRFFDL